ncbi:Sensor protein FixL [Symmachiella macrocystis]|uniref:histidine kinase n=1 Tax=Symmachiella macrocystis TaxID=2527985 RepID=A0A5C6BNM7_9PLAN|nr:CHASE domain-containing protein [Symmachiella macrocystis]TWU13347.1 Sensor protein FixL [Symmachiella macrocystis]
MAKWLIYSALMAGGYFLSGRMGQFLAVPPSYATAIWPASGIALAGVLLMGYRVCFGLFVGALLVNGWTPLSTADCFDAAVSSLLLAISISLGATAQAGLGAILIRRRVGFPNALIQDRQIVEFLAIGGPLACLVGATVGVTSLAFVGAVDGSHFALNWWTWWAGDVIGVIIFAPLTLICFGRPRSAWRSRRISVALPLFAAFTFIVAGFVSTQIFENANARREFNEIADEAGQRLEEQLLDPLDSLHDLQDFCAHSVDLKHSEFASFNRYLLTRHPGLNAVAWLQRVHDSERNEARSQPREPGLFEERGPSGALRPAAKREGYFPVSYMEPQQAEMISPGFDIASNPALRNSLWKCCDLGRRLVAGPVRLNNTRDVRHFFLVFVPIYSHDADSVTVSDLRQSLRGFILGVFHASDVVLAAFPKHNEKKFSLTIRDGASDAPAIYTQLQDVSPHKTSEVAPFLRKPIKSSVNIKFADRNWICEFTPSSSYYTSQVNRHTWFILACSLSLTALLGVFLLILSGRTARIEASESRYLDLYENAPDMFLSIDVSMESVIECNKTFLAATGFSKADVIHRNLYNLFDPNSLSVAQNAFRSFLVSGQGNDIELSLLCSDGQLIDTSMNMSAVRDAQGESVFCRAVLRDISIKKRLETQIRNQEIKLAHVARLNMMGEMATGLAHEINQPLGAIAAYAEGAAIRIRNANSDAQSLSRIIDRIAACAHRASEVIRRLRQFVRTRSSKWQEVDMNQLVHEVAQFVEPDVKHRHVRLGLDLAEPLPGIHGDAVQIQQVLLNLVLNGCDAMSEIEPTQRHLTIRTRLSGRDSVDVLVEDCGHGFPEGVNEQVFEAFFSTKEDGLGMGLAISRSIIESHGGHICVTRNPKGGASFQFSLTATDGDLSID